MRGGGKNWFLLAIVAHLGKVWCTQQLFCLQRTEGFFVILESMIVALYLRAKLLLQVVETKTRSPPPKGFFGLIVCEVMVYNCSLFLIEGFHTKCSEVGNF